MSTPVLMIVSSISEMSNVKEHIGMSLMYILAVLNYASMIATSHSKGYEATSIAPLELHDTSVHCSCRLTHHTHDPIILFHT